MKKLLSAENFTIVNSYYCSSESELFLELFKLLKVKLNRQFFRNYYTLFIYYSLCQFLMSLFDW